MPDAASLPFKLPDRFEDWFEGRGWQPRAHQLALTETSLKGDSALLIAPTGGGKTLAGFLASLIELSDVTPPPPAGEVGGEAARRGEPQSAERGASPLRPAGTSPVNGGGVRTKRPALHTLYISPLKALATDVERNLNTPVAEMGLGIRIETRTGDTPQSKRQRQRANPPDILLTTPEQLALFIASDHADEFFSDLKCVIIDEIHAIAASKRGDLLSLGLATLAEWAPACRFIGLSATVRDPGLLADWLDVRKATSPLRPAGTSPRKRFEAKDKPSDEDLASPTEVGEVPEGRRGQVAGRAPSDGFAATSPAGGGGKNTETPPKRGVKIIRAEGGVGANIDILISRERIPWSGHSGRFAIPEVYEAIKAAEMALVFVNTRSQAELIFQELWRANEDALPIALHHGSLAVEQRRKVEAAMAKGVLKGVVCTSTLDLGIDWGGVDLVIQMGAPKGAARLIQRIGRANHRMDEASRALLVPTNRFEVLECRAAEAAVEAGEIDGEPMRQGALDVLAQHIMGRACGVGFELEPLFNEIRRAAPYEDLDWETYERVVDLVATGGYALKTYDRFRRIVRMPDGVWRVRTARDAQQHRMNVGAIVEAQLLSVRLANFVGRNASPPPPAGEVGGGAARRGLRSQSAQQTNRSSGSIGGGEGHGSGQKSGAAPAASPLRPSGTSPVNGGGGSAQRAIRPGRKLGEIEEYFISTLTPGDTFLFAGEILRFIGISELDVLVTRAQTDKPAIPTYNGGKFPLTTFLADRVRHMIHDPAQWQGLPDQVREWFEIQKEKSEIPPPDHLLVETFPRSDRHYLVTYPFEGRLAHQTLGMLLTRRLERAGAKPLGFVASEYAMAVWAMDDMSGLDMDALFHPDMLGDDLEAWLDESPLMKRTFAQAAQISGVIARRLPGKEKTGRQITFSTDLIYDVLRSHEPDHILLQAARQDAATGLLDIRRLSDMLVRIRGKIDHKALEKISPFAVPVMLEIGKERVNSESALEAIVAEAESDLVREAMGR